jgi:3-methyladenine DNA glycosylase AlkD
LVEIRRRLTQAGRLEVAAGIHKSMGDDVDCYGVKPAEVGNIGMEAIRRLRSGGLVLSMAIADALFKSRKLEEGLIGAQIVGALARLIGGGEFDRFDSWVSLLDNAQTSDALALNCISKSVAAKTSLAMKLVDWTKSPNPWRRRAAVMSLSPMVREGRFMTDALTVAEQVMVDSHEEVQRGVGMMLLDASRLQSPRVVEFLVSWKDKSPRLVLQTAVAKLSPEDRKAVLD